MEDKLLEQMAEKVHDSWKEEKKRQEYHAPKKCNWKPDISTLLSDKVEVVCEAVPTGRGTCTKCHKDMIPYSELSEDVKDLDRVMVMKFEEQLKELGYAIGRDYSNPMW